MSFSSELSVQIYDEKPVTPLEKHLFDLYLAKKGHVLDLGCGTGRTANYLHEQGHRVYGLDISEPMIEQARKNNPDILYLVRDMSNLTGFPNGLFDYVIIPFNSLDYVYPYEKRLKTLREVHRVLKTGGTFIYSSHDKKRLPWRRRLNGKIRRYEKNYYRERYSHGEYIGYWGTLEDNLTQTRDAGFKNLTVFREKVWSYYVSRKE